MIGDASASRLPIETEPLKIRWRNSCQAQVRINSKAEPAIVAGITKNHASLSALASQVGKPRLDHRGADAFPLATWLHRYGTKSEPPVVKAIDHNRGEGHMAYDCPFIVCDK